MAGRAERACGEGSGGEQGSSRLRLPLTATLHARNYLILLTVKKSEVRKGERVSLDGINEDHVVFFMRAITKEISCFDSSQGNQWTQTHYRGFIFFQIFSSLAHI